MKADRLLSSLLLLQSHGRLTGSQLAKRLEVSQRTIHRDMEALSAAGVPVYAQRGSRGGWLLDEGWRTEVPGLDESELRALLMAQPRVLGDARLAGAAESALAKLTAALPDALRASAAAIRERLFVDATDWWDTEEDLSRLPVVQDAVSRDRKLSIRYRPPGGESGERTVDPLGLVAKGRTWYLVAQTPRGLRTYRVSRIEEARLLDVPSVRPAGFDLAAAWKAATERVRKERTRYEVTLRLEPRAASRLRRWRIASDTGEPPDAAGWVTLRATFGGEEEAAFAVLGFGPLADVLEPASLRERVSAEVDAVIGRRRRGARGIDTRKVRDAEAARPYGAK